MKICVRLKTVLIGAVIAVFRAGWQGAGWPAGKCREGCAAGSDKRPMTFADLMAMKRVSDPQISSSGKWVLFSVMDVGLEKNTKVNHLWVVPIDGSTAGEAGDIRRWGDLWAVLAGRNFGVVYRRATKDDPVSRITVATWDEKTGTIQGQIG